jgi:hypothetical protein
MRWSEPRRDADHETCTDLMMSLRVFYCQASIFGHLRPKWGYDCIDQSKNCQMHHITWWLAWVFQIGVSLFLKIAIKYFNKYALTTNVSAYVKYVNTFVCQNYLCKIVLLCIFVPTCQKRMCRAQLYYVNSSDMQMYWHILHIWKHLWSMHIYLNILNMLKNS